MTPSAPPGATTGPEGPDPARGSGSSPAAPLAGLRVLDMSRVVAGPMCGRLLADLGAEVVKLEPPRGDSSRTVLPVVGDVGAYFSQLNAGKRNISVDLAHPEGAELVGRLAGKADVLLENFRPGVLARYGLGPGPLLERHPRLIYCSISGYGQDGPWASRGAYAPLVHAEAGTLEMAARRRRSAIAPEVQSHGDAYPALMATNAILAALIQRSATGRGQHLDVAMAEVLLYTNEWTAVELAGGGSIEQLFGAWNSPLLSLRSGRTVAFAGNPVFSFPSWARGMGRPELLEDARFATTEARQEHRDAVIEVLADFVGRFDTVEELEKALGPHRLPAGTVRSVNEVVDTEWSRARGVVAEVSPGVRIPAAPFRATGFRVGAGAPAASRGQHNREVLNDWIGLSATEVATLQEEGVLVGADKIG
ncbi:MAG: CaiB/BaiF CoA transferase family protein [Acidimicrobiales bacterium]